MSELSCEGWKGKWTSLKTVGITVGVRFGTVVVLGVLVILMMIAETFTDLLTDWNHWGFEIVAAAAEFVVVGLILTPVIKRWVRKHDKIHHNHDCGKDSSG